MAISLGRLTQHFQTNPFTVLIYPLVMTNIAIENDPVEIVDVPIKTGGFP